MKAEGEGRAPPGGREGTGPRTPEREGHLGWRGGGEPGPPRSERGDAGADTWEEGRGGEAPLRLAAEGRGGEPGRGAVGGEG